MIINMFQVLFFFLMGFLTASATVVKKPFGALKTIVLIKRIFIFVN